MNNIISIQMCFREQVGMAIQAYCYRKGLPHGSVDGKMRDEVHRLTARFFRYCGKNMAQERLWTQDDLVSLVGVIIEAYDAGYTQRNGEDAGER